MTSGAAPALANARGRAVGAVVAALLCGLAVPAPALAHAPGSAAASDYEARLVGIRPTVPGVTAAVLDGDERLRLTVAEGRTISVLGVLGEPFLRFAGGAVQVNEASPTAGADGLADPERARGAPRWRTVAHGESFAWHEPRLRPLPVRRFDGTSPARVARWSIPLRVGGTTHRVVGDEWYAPPPSLRWWIVFAAAALGTAATAALRLPAAATRAAVFLAIPVLTAALVSQAGTWLAGDPSASTVAATVLYLALMEGVAVAALALTGARQRVFAALGAGAVSLFVGLPQATVFVHGFPLAALPDWIARASDCVALVGGAALLVLGAPAVASLARHADVGLSAR